MSNLAVDKQEPDESVEARPSAPAASGDVRPVPRISVQAFCDSAELAAAIEAAAGDRRMARAHVKVHVGGIAAAAEFYQEAATPNLIIVETNLAGAELVRQLDQLAEVCDAGSKVIVVGRVNDVELYRDLIRRGVSEYMVAPVDTLGIIRSIADLFVDRAAAPLGRSIAFIGGKGGVGSSMLAHNVAWSIARGLESDVVIADLDLAFGTAGLDFNQDPIQGVAEAIAAPDRLDEVFLERLLARCSDHLSLLAAPAMLERTYDFDENTFAQVIDVAQAGVPAVIVDLPHSWTAWVRKTLVSADEVVLTVEPDLGNLRNAKNLVDLLRQVRKNDAPPRLVVNKAGVPKRPEISVDDFAEALDLAPDAVVPFDPQLFGTAANNGQMIAEADPKSAVVESFNHIARIVTGRGDAKRQKRGGLAPLFSRLRGKSA